MEKVTKKELQQEINILKSKNITNRNLIFRIKRALASIDIEIMDDEFDAEPEPKLKQLDQSDFKDIDIDWNFLAVDSDGALFAFARKPNLHGAFWGNNDSSRFKRMSGKGCYDASNWQNSLIERDKVEESDYLDGTISNIVDELLDSQYFYSKITCELLSKGCSYVLAYVSDVSEQNAMENKEVAVIDSVDVLLNDTDGNDWKYAIPINNQGEPLTAADVGL